MRHRVRQADGVADGEYDVTDPELIGAAERRHGEGTEIDLQDRKVRVGIAADNMGIRYPAVLELHPHRFGVGNDVMIGDDVAALVHDHPGAQAALDSRPITGQDISEQLAQRRRYNPIPHQAGRVDVHHGRRGAVDCGGVGHPRGRWQGRR